MVLFCCDAFSRFLGFVFFLRCPYPPTHAPLLLPRNSSLRLPRTLVIPHGWPSYYTCTIVCNTLPFPPSPCLSVRLDSYSCHSFLSNNTDSKRSRSNFDNGRTPGNATRFLYSLSWLYYRPPYWLSLLVSQPPIYPSVPLYRVYPRVMAGPLIESVHLTLKYNRLCFSLLYL